MNAYQGKKKRWWNYLPLLIDLAVFLSPTINAQVLWFTSSRVADTVLQIQDYIYFNASQRFAEIISTGDSVATSIKTVVSIVSISLVAIIIVLFFINFATFNRSTTYRRQSQQKSLFRVIVLGLSLILYDFCIVTVVNYSINSISCVYVDDASSFNKSNTTSSVMNVYQSSQYFPPYLPGMKLVGVPYISCDGGYLHLVYFYLVTVSTCGALLLSGIGYLVVARNIQTNPVNSSYLFLRLYTNI
jgi:hypothetical protein